MTIIHCDGSCIKNNDTCSAGYGIIIENGVPLKKYGKVRGLQTNNRAELEGVYHSLLYAIDNCLHARIYTDSLLVVNGINGDSQRKANRDIWKDIEDLCHKISEKNLDIKVLHLDKSKLDEHDEKFKYNVQADRLAFKGANALLL